MTNSVCMCAPGSFDVLCATQSLQSCYANITTPAFYKGCNGTDSAYYMYSLQGYAPCEYFDFSAELTVEVYLNCQLAIFPEPDTNTTNVTATVGFEYRDVISAPVAANTLAATSFTDELTLNFNIRDFRYLSNANTTNKTVIDAD